MIDTALDLVRAHGPDALTMRALAEALQVSPGAIYWHIESRDTLVAQVVERAGEGFQTLRLKGATPRDRIIELGLADWRVIRSEPHLARLARDANRWEAYVGHLMARLRVELSEAGLRGKALTEAVFVVRSCVAGFLTHSMNEATSPPEAPSTTRVEVLLRATLTVVVDDLLPT